MFNFTSIQTGSVFISPHHNCGEQGYGLVRHKMAMVLDSGDTAEISVKDQLHVWHTFLCLVSGYLEGFK